MEEGKCAEASGLLISHFSYCGSSSAYLGHNNLQNPGYSVRVVHLRYALIPNVRSQEVDGGWEEQSNQVSQNVSPA